MEFKVGDLVRIDKSSQYYGNQPSRTHKDAVGRIREIGGSIQVVWKDLNYSNTYDDYDLELAEINWERELR